MNKYTLGAIVAAILAAQGVMAQPGMGREMQRGPIHAGNPGGMRGGEGIGMLMRVSRDAELQKQAGITEDEAAKLQELATKVQRDMIDLKAAKDKAELDLKTVLDGSTPDRDAAMAAADAVSAAQAALMKANIDTQLKVIELLGAEKVDALQQARPDKRMEMRRDGRDSREKKWGSKKAKGLRAECPPADEKDDDDEVEDND